jgi:hypothetical protein
VITQSEQAERAAYPDLRSNFPIWLAFIPRRWDVADDGKGGRAVVPALKELRATPGSDGVGMVQRADGSRVPDMRQAFDNLKERGHFVIPHDVDGPGTTYLSRTRVGTAWHPKSGEELAVWHWHLRWTRCHPGSAAYTTDTGGYTGWLRSLIERGVLPPPAPDVLDELESRYEALLERAQQRYANRSDHQLIALHRANVAAIRAERARLITAAAEYAGELDVVTEGEDDPRQPEPQEIRLMGSAPKPLPPEPRASRRGA